jgi:hypothetical protein
MELDIEPGMFEAGAIDVPLAPDEAFNLFIDTAAMHRESAIAKGFSPEAAETMAVALHSGLVALYFTSVQ